MRGRPSRNASPASEQDWQPPNLTGGFKQRIASSIVEEFVAGHDASDVLRELVQNEFDAGGTQVSVGFGTSSLTVVGNGRPIDTKGWSRLDVILGTGNVVGGGDQGRVDPKENGIGSKNFGLRSLFLFGDRIHVRSNGHMAVLDLPTMGTQHLMDVDSRGRRGVSVHVPYRLEQFQSLEPFTVEREQRALDHIQEGLLATLVKLALPGSRPGIRALTLISERTGRQFVWRQKAKTLRCKVKGVSIVSRIGRLSSIDPIRVERARLQTFEEIEFSRSFPIPAEHINVLFPAYYRTSSNYARVAISMSIRGNRVDRNAHGQFYYPLQTPQGFTGTAVSISAPFKLNADRTNLLDSTWNKRLAEESVRLVQDLLSEDWLQRFGAEAYLVLDTVGGANPDVFATKIAEHLREAECWPTRNFHSKKTLARISDIVLSDGPEYDDLLSDKRYLDQRLADRKIAVDLAYRNGAKRFTLSSLVRLRCAGENRSKLSTNLESRKPTITLLTMPPR